MSRLYSHPREYRKIFLGQQDTKEYLNQRGTWIGVFRESKKGDKGGEKWWESEQGLKGKEGEKEGRKVGGKGPKNTLEKLWFWYPSDLGTL